MSWVKIDDKATRHKKQLKAGAEACWLWVCGLSYAKEQPEHDGAIPSEVLTILYPFKNAQALASKLVSVGLWERTADGYQIHDWADWNGTAEDIEAAKQRSRDRAAVSYAKKRNSAPQTLDTSAPVLHRRDPAETPQSAEPLREVYSDSSGSIPSPSPSPDPDPPVAPPSAGPTLRLVEPVAPEPKRQPKRAQLTTIPADWLPTDSVLAEIATTHGATVDDIRYQAEEFRAYWLSGGGAGEKKSQWLKTFRNRIHSMVQNGRRISRPVSGRDGGFATAGTGSAANSEPKTIEQVLAEQAERDRLDRAAEAKRRVP